MLVIAPVLTVPYLCHRGGGSYSYHPLVDEGKCTSCKLCLKVCPLLENTNQNVNNPKAYAAQASDELRLSKSSSGAVFPLLARYFLANGGVVCGAGFQKVENSSLPILKHIIIEKPEDLPLILGSKYVQSDLSGVFEKLRESLKDGRLVLFCGLPCEVAGLKKYLKKSYENLLTIDLICHGVPSYALWAKGMKERFNELEIIEQSFRDKRVPWGAGNHAGTISTKQGKIEQNASDDAYLRAFYSNLSLNNACFSCKFSTLPRTADITLGDFWGVGEYDAKMDDKKGTSAVIINNQNGQNFIEKIKNEFKLFESVPLNAVAKYNPNLISPSKKHINYRLFWQLLERGEALKNAVEICLDDKCDFALYNFWYANNYGASITAFALQRLLWDLGYSSKYINMDFGEGWPSGFSADFAAKYLDLTPKYSDEALAIRQFNFKGFIFGSDQVSRPQYHFKEKSKILEHFLGLEQRRLMISTSFGENLETFKKNTFGAYTRSFYNGVYASFDYISCREESGRQIVRKLFGVEADFMLDPVFLVEGKHYDELIANNNVKLPEKFALFYLLYECDEALYNEAIKRLKNELNMPVVLLKPSSNASVETFLAAFKGASFVLTDSFHGVCFSVIFGKDFSCVSDESRGGERFEALKNMLKIHAHCFASAKSVEFKKVDYEGINAILDAKKKESFESLKNALAGQNTNKNANFGKVSLSAVASKRIKF